VQTEDAIEDAPKPGALPVRATPRQEARYSF